MNLDAGGPSRTAEYVALFRALESARSPDRRAFDDPYARHFLSRRLNHAVTMARVPVVGPLVPRYIDRRWPGPRPSAVRRTVLIDDAVRAAIAAGCEQLVILGAGYDTRAYRLPELADTPVFEVDLASTQERKRDAMQAALGSLPARVRFVSLDFERDDLGSVMRRAGLRSGARTLFIWEGVLSYLEPDAIDATLGWMATAAAQGSRVIFTYINRSHLDGESTPWLAAVRAVGEPMKTGLDPAALDAFMSERGMGLLSEEASDDRGFYRVAVAETLTPAPPAH